MSVNLHLSITVRGYLPGNAAAIERAVREVVEREQLENDLPLLVEGEDTRGKFLATQSDRDSPVSISRAYTWCPEFQTALKEVATRANEQPCEVTFDWKDADAEETADYEPDDKTS